MIRIVLPRKKSSVLAVPPWPAGFAGAGLAAGALAAGGSAAELPRLTVPLEVQAPRTSARVAAQQAAPIRAVIASLPRGRWSCERLPPQRRVTPSTLLARTVRSGTPSSA